MKEKLKIKSRTGTDQNPVPARLRRARAGGIRWVGWIGWAGGLRTLSRILMICFALPVVLGLPARGDEQKKKAPELSLPAVKNITEADWKRVLARRQGSVLVVNFWATWCEPCREEFGRLNRLSRKWKGKGLAVVTVSLNPQEERGKVLAFLRTYKASFENYHQDFKDIAEFTVTLDPDWWGTLPATFLYGRQGRLRQVYKGSPSFRELERAVIPLLEESGKP